MLGALHDSAEVYEGYDAALIGLSFRPNSDKPVALYDRDVFISLMMSYEDLTKEEAEDALLAAPGIHGEEEAWASMFSTGQPVIVGTKVLWN
tara:strand:- start:3451 stop:3726 length:276 start_codon:yes stop_codon:yes gene_type:complete